jgi:protein-S-isoprenylcysteine O-methyltransferase Ste14
MTELLIFALGTAVFAWLSRQSLRKPRSHGFYRFFAWVCILALVLVNFPMWERDPLVPRQLVSWTLLAVSFALALHALRLLRRVGRPDEVRRRDAELYAFERTSTLVTSGAFRYIRHPMYAALLYLAWGAFLKHVSPTSVALVTGASAALLLTALRDEAECLDHFGSAYASYMKTSKRFVPFVF